MGPPAMSRDHRGPRGTGWPLDRAVGADGLHRRPAAGWHHASGEVRARRRGTREWALLQPGRMVDSGSRRCAHRRIGLRVGGVRRCDPLVRGTRPRASHQAGRCRSWWAWCCMTSASAIRASGPDRTRATRPASRPGGRWRQVQPGPVGAGCQAPPSASGPGPRPAAPRARQRRRPPWRPGGGGPSRGQRRR